MWVISSWDNLGYMTEMSLSMNVQTHAHLLMRGRRSNQPIPEAKQTEASSSKKTLTLISLKLINKEIAKRSTIIALIAREITDESKDQISHAAIPILKEFVDVFSEKLPDSLPPMRDIQHAINLVSGSSLSNLPHYRMNPTEHTKLKWQVDELFSKGSSKKV